MKLFIILSLVLISSSSFGQSQIVDVQSSYPEYVPYISSIDSSFERCDSTWVTNTEWGLCLGEHTKLWEDQMKKFYDSLMTELDAGGKKLLKISQTDWVNQVQSQQDFWGYFEETSANYFGREGHFKACYHRLIATRDRADELRAYLNLIREIKKEKAKD